MRQSLVALIAVLSVGCADLEKEWAWEENATRAAPLAARQEREALGLRRALAKYGRHPKTCAKWDVRGEFFSPDGQCTCGLSALLAGEGGSECKRAGYNNL